MKARILGKEPRPEPGKGFDFPCTVPVKAMGRAEEEFVDTVVAIVRRHAEVQRELVRTRESGSGKFLSVTVEVTFSSRGHMERVYQDLHEHDDVLWTL